MDLSNDNSAAIQINGEFMKIAILLTCLISTSLMAKTTVTVPFEVEMNRKTITAAEFNKTFKLQGEDKIVENVVVSNEQASYSDANKTYWAQSEKVDAIASKLHKEINFKLSDPHGCYSGVASEAVTIIAGLADGLFSDQLGLFGYKYKKEMELVDSSDEDAKAFLNTESKTWKNWKGNDESILILFHVGDDGDDVNEAIITKCK